MHGFFSDRELKDGSLSWTMAGKRALEIMLGKLLGHIQDRQMEKRTSLDRELLTLHKGGLPREYLVTLLSEYYIAFVAFITSLELKTDFTNSLPFALAGLASSDGVAARSLALRLIDIFAHSDVPMSTARGGCSSVHSYGGVARRATARHHEEGDDGQESVRESSEFGHALVGDS